MGILRQPASSLADLATAWDRAVDATPGADQFCASSIWSFAAAESFPTAGPPQVVASGSGFCGMRQTTTADGVEVMVGLDPIWGFATPCVGPPPAAAGALADLLEQVECPVAMIGGQREDSVLSAHIARNLDRSHRLLHGPEEIRIQADLRDGVDAWFGRRSGRFRQRMRRIERDALSRSVEIQDISADRPDGVIDRIAAIEARSWKGRANDGLMNDDLAQFYRRMAWRLARADALRALVAVADDDGDPVDVGYILGGVRGRTYRGLQLSYADHWADLGIGHLLQMHQLRAVAREGIEVYDLGMDMPYKRRWADARHDTFSIIAVQRHG